MEQKQSLGLAVSKKKKKTILTIRNLRIKGTKSLTPNAFSQSSATLPRLVSFQALLLCKKRSSFVSIAYIPQSKASCPNEDGAHKGCRIRSPYDCLFSGSTQGLCTSEKLRGRRSGRGGASVLPLLCSYWPYLI